VSAHRLAPRAALLLVAFAVGACKVKEAGTDSAINGDSSKSAATATSTAAALPAANVITVTAKDYSFDAPAEIPAGLTTIRLVTEGKEMHHATFVKLEDGKTVDDFIQAIQKQGPPPAWMIASGGPNPPRPGGVTEETQLLEPGNYVIVCFVPSPDGKPHVAKGMVRPITVTPATASNASTTAAPVPDITIKLVDYGFESSKPLTAGKHLIRIENDAAQDHELVLVRLAPGKTVEELAKWIDKMDGPPPGEPLGGLAGIHPGGYGFITADLTPGDYGFLCFIPDAKDGKPHVMHGMVKQFRVEG
jgi:plastocyanin